jgi:nucleotide-binding universal stress UspA family protein
MKKNVIIVPTDFSVVALCAYEHALTIAGQIPGSEVVVLHIIAKEKDQAAANEKLQAFLKEKHVPQGVTLISATRVGNIFDDIGSFASELGAKLIVMGTHGVKGFQFILGSHAVKVITNSSVPFIVVQERGIGHGYKKIVLPMDMTKEAKQKLALTISIAKTFGSKVLILHPDEKDPLQKKTIVNNVAMAKSDLRDHGVEFEVVVAPDGNFVKNLLSFSANNQADLIAIVNSQEAGFPEILAGTDERTIITNDAQIPVMIVNPIKGMYGGSVVFS